MLVPVFPGCQPSHPLIVGARHKNCRQKKPLQVHWKGISGARISAEEVSITTARRHGTSQRRLTRKDNKIPH